MRLLLSLALLSVLCAPAYAGTVSSVGSPGVSKGKTKVELRVGFSEAEEDSSQDERVRYRQQIDYGVNDWYAVRLVLLQDDRKGNNFEHNGIGLTQRFQFLDKSENGFDLGARIEYTHADGDKTPHTLATGLYQLFPLEEYEIRMNQIVSHDIGEDAGDGIGAELRFQVTREIFGSHRIGLESFNDFGNLSELSGFDDQDHDIGPVLKGKFGEGWAYETGYRAGISDGAADHNFKVFISKGF